MIEKIRDLLPAPVGLFGPCKPHFLCEPPYIPAGIFPLEAHHDDIDLHGSAVVKIADGLKLFPGRIIFPGDFRHDH